MSEARAAHTEGLFYALAAYCWWGLVPPFYFKALSHVAAKEILAHRILWSVPLLIGLVWLWHRWPELKCCLRDWAILRALLLTTVLIAINWLVYIHGVVTEQIVQTALGYFINPLVNVLLGMFVFHERLRGLQWLAVALAAAGVLTLTWQESQLPWIALTLAFSFGLYGMVRKTVPADGLVSLSVETVLLLPVTIGYLIWLQVSGQGAFLTQDGRTDALLLAAGIVTIVPLLCFGQAARMLPLTTLGFIQYLSPTCQFIVAVIWFREPLDAWKLASFCCIWLALAAFSVDTFLHYRQQKALQERLTMSAESAG